MEPRARYRRALDDAAARYRSTAQDDPARARRERLNLENEAASRYRRQARRARNAGR